MNINIMNRLIKEKEEFIEHLQQKNLLNKQEVEFEVRALIFLMLEYEKKISPENFNKILEYEHLRKELYKKYNIPTGE